MDLYKSQVRMGLYPSELNDAGYEEEEKMKNDDEGELPEGKHVLPWTYCPAKDRATCLNLVEELLHLIIILITVSHPEGKPKNACIFVMCWARRIWPFEIEFLYCHYATATIVQNYFGE